VETFIVRVWTPAPKLAAEISSRELRGNVEHLPSKQQLTFRSTDDLIEILRRLPGGTASASPERKESG
jgi:hypothetical protein